MIKNLYYLFFISFSLLLQSNSTYSQSNNLSFSSWFSGSKDFIEVSYGIGEFKHKGIATEFNKFSMSEIKIGRRFIKPIGGYKLIEFSDNYLFSSYLDDNQGAQSDPLNISYEMWRFGLGYRKGYGYNWKSFAILPHYQLGLVWHKSNFSHPLDRIKTFDSNPLNIAEKRKIELYNDVIKFGTSNAGGIDFRISSLIGIGVSYETEIIFPYHKFWKQVGSFFIETLSQTGIDFLTEGVIIKQVPDIAPVLYFILKNGLSYYFYTLKQDDMNWPFDTALPLTMEAVKFELKISF
ncbi:MAG: hypothetical protein KDC88_12250 [Ignavibacteriae bacterium]|nr:hypothetical protein [Ignavibacteriota bacterium]MCB9207017.1 hypothetical protein [Ignavibacteriales bacterium]MCB9207764.1 hypothetical protein [Ignavibacteriales bacterium]MCB9258534.1 hypothetical protein [Ignavibacteriales bacterium]